jgi:hypothetical protein
MWLHIDIKEDCEMYMGIKFQEYGGNVDVMTRTEIYSVSVKCLFCT